MRANPDEDEKKIKLLEYQMIPEPKIRALWDRGTPSPVYILRRGNPTSFGHEVGRRVRRQCSRRQHCHIRLQSALAGAREDGPTAGVRGMDDESRPSAYVARDGEPHLETSFRDRDRQVARKLRQDRNARRLIPSCSTGSPQNSSGRAGA